MEGSNSFKAAPRLCLRLGAYDGGGALFLLLEEQRISHRLEELEGPSKDSTAAAAADARPQQGSIPDAWMRKHVLRKRRVNKDIVKSECLKNLGEQELQWCREVDVSPHHFALVRDALVREAVKGSPEGGGSSSGRRPLVLKVARAEPLSRTFKFEVVGGEDKQTSAAPPKPEASTMRVTIAAVGLLGCLLLVLPSEGSVYFHKSYPDPADDLNGFDVETDVVMPVAMRRRSSGVSSRRRASSTSSVGLRGLQCRVERADCSLFYFSVAAMQ
ncbi:hypothetical protein FOZ62_010713, partial [Perkinsus olseni]